MINLKQEIFKIDSRITTCIVEVDEDYFYAKTWFMYKNTSDTEIKSGRQEFEAITKEMLFEDIKIFLNKTYKFEII